MALTALLGKGMGETLKGVIYLHVRWLGLALTAAALVSVAVIAHLFENHLPKRAPQPVYAVRAVANITVFRTGD